MVPRPADANIVTCKWVFTIKYHPDGTIARHKARLVARGFTQAYVIDYTKTFSLVVRLNFVCVLLSLVVNKDWSLTCHFRASLKHKDDGQTKFIKPNSQRQDIIIKYLVSIGSIHREQS